MVEQILLKDVFETYGYFYIDEKTKHGFLIDPGAEADRILRMIHKNGWTIEKILLTHGHFDHTGAVKELSETLNIPYMIHRNGERYLKDIRLNLSSFCNRNIILNQAQYFDEGDIIGLEGNEDFALRVIHTPGHTPDSVVFYNQEDQVAFVGDTIFKGSIGNTGYPGGDPKLLQNSIVNRIFSLPEDTKLYSGHSEMTTVGIEINRYIR